MDQILTQILDACRQAHDFDRTLRLSDVALDPDFLLATCEDLAAAFHQAASALRARVLPFEPPRVEQQVAQLSPLRRESPSERRLSKKRKKGAVTRTVPAVRIGDAVVPLDDGYTWRKYGQKDIHNSKFPRSYYRCTHKSFYGCGAKKQVQRLDDDPSTFEVTYRGEHTCQTSTTPLFIPSIPVDVENRGPVDGEGSSVQLHLQAMAGPSSSSQPQIHSWLGGENRGPGDGEGLSAQLQLQAMAGPSSSQPQFQSWPGGENRGPGDGEDPSAQFQLQAMAGPSSSRPQFQSWLGGENRDPSGGENPSAQLQLQAMAGSSSSQPQFQSWLGGENRGPGGGEDPSAQLQLQAMAGTSSSQPQVLSWLGGVGSGQAATARQGGGRDVDVSVAELADAMFNNPGSSGSSSMDAIFPPKRGN
ncbi:probable WRKY transcription factor 61 [Zingiber officinale]|uniref:WRKY domain-containing protein n=1 Tax=Zingiber officinale TaxID=94328 RepID=A0A8J5HFU0_ZINOF|nr:probable WRKY transcription factor 61 [Zingiber officinale]KAG6526643.1 hypothetical protein ZIOFF_016637 [Zingiber officinale]